MKNLALVFFLISISLASLGQEEHKEELDIEDLYSLAIKVYCDSVTSMNADLVLVDSQDFPTNQLPAMIGDITIRILSYNELIKLTSHRMSVDLIKVFPIQSKNGVFSIGINSYRVSRNGKNIEYSLQMGMGINVMFNYDCSSNSFKLNDIE